MGLQFIGFLLLSLLGIIVASFFRAYFSKLLKPEDSIRKINSFVARASLHLLVLSIVLANIFIFIYDGYFNPKPLTRSDVADLIISGLTMTLTLAMGTLYGCVVFIGKKQKPEVKTSDVSGSAQ